MPINVNDVVRIVTRGRIHGQKTINVYHFKAVNAGGDELLQALLTAFLQCITLLLARQSNEFQHEGATATKLSGSFDEITDTSASAFGSVGLDGLPTFCAGLIRFHTDKFGRSGRGRSYLPGFAEASTDNSLFSDPDDILQDFLICLLDKFKLNGGTDANWKMVVLSRKHLKQNPGDFNGATSFVVGGSVDAVVRTMRSRMIGKGD